MPYEIKVSPTYTGQTDDNCAYRWCWYVWDPTDHVDYVEGDLVRETIGISPDVSNLLVNEIKIWMSRYDEIIKSKKLNKLTTFLHENYFSCNGLKRVLFDGE